MSFNLGDRVRLTSRVQGASPRTLGVGTVIEMRTYHNHIVRERAYVEWDNGSRGECSPSVLKLVRPAHRPARPNLTNNEFK